jgi:hypothetical protein
MRFARTIVAVVALAGSLDGGAARAQMLRDFCADRPGKATPACILDAGHVQVETALADAVFQRGSGVHEDLYAFGASELRFGLTSRVEAEAAWTPLIVDRLRGAGERTGVGDLTLGLRGALTSPDSKGPMVSLQGFVTAPTATHGLGAGGWTGGLRLPLSAPLANDFGLGLTPEVDVARNAQGGGVHPVWTNVVSVGRTFGKASFGVEAWGSLDDDPGGRSRQASADLTAALALGENAQLDAGANFGLTRATPDLELYVGLSHRF